MIAFCTFVISMGYFIHIQEWTKASHQDPNAIRTGSSDPADYTSNLNVVIGEVIKELSSISLLEDGKLNGVETEITA